MLENPPAKEETACSADLGSIPGSTRSPEEGHGNALLYSCLGNLKERGAPVHGIAKSQTRLSKRVHTHIHTHTHTHTHTPVLRQSDKSSTCVVLPSVPNTCTRQFYENVLIKTNMNIYIYI